MHVASLLEAIVGNDSEAISFHAVSFVTLSLVSCSFPNIG